MTERHPTLTFAFQNIHIDRPDLDDYYRILLGVVGDFTIVVAGKTPYVEQEFCLVEFAMDVSSWWQRARLAHDDFNYESIESAEFALVWI